MWTSKNAMAAERYNHVVNVKSNGDRLTMLFGCDRTELWRNVLCWVDSVLVSTWISSSEICCWSSAMAAILSASLNLTAITSSLFCWKEKKLRTCIYIQLLLNGLFLYAYLRTETLNIYCCSQTGALTTGTTKPYLKLSHEWGNATKSYEDVVIRGIFCFFVSFFVILTD